MASYIKGTGNYVPESRITNEELSRILKVDEGWIFQRTGIIERRRCDLKGTSEMGYYAARDALTSARIEPEKVGSIVFATVTPDFPTPSCACMLQSMLGIRNAIAFDISAACSGFLYGLFLSSLISERTGKPSLLVGAECLTRFVNYTDRNTSILFGDAAGAVVVSNEDGHKILDLFLSSDGNGWKSLLIPAGGARLPASPITIRFNLHTFRMKGREVFRNAVSKMEEAIKIICERNGLSPHEVALFIPHQANERITKAIAEDLGIDGEKIYSNISRLGNTSSASIPVALREIEEKGILKRGDLLCMASFGAGYTYGACLVEW